MICTHAETPSTGIKNHLNFEPIEHNNTQELKELYFERNNGQKIDCLKNRKLILKRGGGCPAM